ncbi:hypothetical protein B1810_13835 [Panacagrimonas perspica]|nr:hypothetical protein B1810_13835 [Panacagrimonas perspica]
MPGDRFSARSADDQNDLAHRRQRHIGNDDVDHTAESIECGQCGQAVLRECASQGQRRTGKKARNKAVEAMQSIERVQRGQVGDQVAHQRQGDRQDDIANHAVEMERLQVQGGRRGMRGRRKGKEGSSSKQRVTSHEKISRARE